MRKRFSGPSFIICFFGAFNLTINHNNQNKKMNVLPSYEDKTFQTNFASTIVYIHILVSNCSSQKVVKVKRLFFLMKRFHVTKL